MWRAHRLRQTGNFIWGPPAGTHKSWRGVIRALVEGARNGPGGNWNDGVSVLKNVGCGGDTFFRSGRETFPVAFFLFFFVLLCDEAPSLYASVKLTKPNRDSTPQTPMPSTPPSSTYQPPGAVKIPGCEWRGWLGVWGFGRVGGGQW